jgi:cytochrome c biogenesis protein CcdA
MWILKFLPDWIFYAVLLIGLAGLAASFVLKFVPVVRQYQLPIQAISGILIVFGVYMAGAISNETAWQARVTELQLKIARAEAQSAEANGQLTTKLLRKEQEIVLAQQLLKTRIQQNAVQMDAVCTVPRTAIDILNDAARKTGDAK